MKQAAVVAALVLSALSYTAQAAEPAKASKADIERGRYLVKIADCNGCHTVGFPESGGKVPEADWLAGSPVGFQGPWGTTYPSNLRLLAQQMTEEQWLARSRGPMRPPMPYTSLNWMTDADVKAIYRYIRSLGPKGEPAPDYAPPGTKVKTPYIDFVPKNLPASPAAK